MSRLFFAIDAADKTLKWSLLEATLKVVMESAGDRMEMRRTPAIIAGQLDGKNETIRAAKQLDFDARESAVEYRSIQLAKLLSAIVYRYRTFLERVCNAAATIDEWQLEDPYRLADLDSRYVAVQFATNLVFTASNYHMVSEDVSESEISAMRMLEEAEGHIGMLLYDGLNDDSGLRSNVDSLIRLMKQVMDDAMESNQSSADNGEAPF